MLSPGRKVLYLLIFFAIPPLFWISPDTKVHLISFLLIGILYLISRYWKTIHFLQQTAEVLFLYLILVYLTEQFDLQKLFPANSIIIIVSMYVFLLALKKYDRHWLYLAKGNIQSTFGWIVFFSFLAIASLTTWFIFQEGNPFAKFMPHVPIPILIPLGVGFAVINGLYEEGLFRSILLAHFSEQIGFWWAILLQSLWFSFLHYQSGFPSGMIGIVLTFVFGLMMGYLVYRTKGLLVPIIVHALADFSIFILIMLRMQSII